MSEKTETLAIHGGTKVKAGPYGKGNRFGMEEIKELTEALEQNTLFYHFGRKVEQFLQDFNNLYGVKYSVATSSGTAAIHTALGSAGVTEGDEIITSPITDQGTVIGILYQNAVPVFADVDVRTYNMKAESIEENISPKTKAIVVVHLAGNPCDMDAIMGIAHKYNLTVIEDCAQSYFTYYKGKLAGTIGDYGCFSTNDFKQMSTGDGGIVIVNSNIEKDYLETRAFADKNYNRVKSETEINVSYLAPNYRMTELQGAVGIAQLTKLPHWCKLRHEYGERITNKIQNIPGILPHFVSEHSQCSYWFYLFRIDDEQFNCTRGEFSDALNAEGIMNNKGYISEPVYQKALFQNKQAYKNSQIPFETSNVVYQEGLCPNAEKVIKSSIKIAIEPFYTKQDIEDIILGIEKVASHYQCVR